jgi:hypothetical protein
MVSDHQHRLEMDRKPAAEFRVLRVLQEALSNIVLRKFWNVRWRSHEWRVCLCTERKSATDNRQFPIDGGVTGFLATPQGHIPPNLIATETGHQGGGNGWQNILSDAPFDLLQATMALITVIIKNQSNKIRDFHPFRGQPSELAGRNFPEPLTQDVLGIAPVR